MAQPSNRHHDVVIIGAGVAGLNCAHQLVHKLGIKDVLVVEAMDRIGGRILPSDDFIPGMTVEIGAELLHGANTVLTRLAEEQNWSLHSLFTWAHGDGGPTEAPSPDGGIGYYYLGDQKRMLKYDDDDAEFQLLNEAVHSLKDGDVNTINAEASLKDYFESKQISESMMKLAEAGYANTAGSDLEEISWRITCRFESQQSQVQDDGQFRYTHTYRRMLDYFKQGINFQLSWPVASIDYRDSDKIVITSKSGERISCNKLVVTVPSSVFLDIEYLPSLPAAKVDAAKSFGMRRAAKVLMHFNGAFWPKDTHGVVCSDSFIPEFWINQSTGIGHVVDNNDKLYTPVAEHQDVQYLVTGFAGSACADRLQNYPEAEVIARFLDQLDEIYGTELEPKPATKYFVKGKHVDWGDVEYIRGGYSYPRVGQSDDASKNLADSVDGRLFFAGEATSFEQPGASVHSAIDTGARAADQVTASLMYRKQLSKY